MKPQAGKSMKIELMNADDMTKQWPKWDLLLFLCFPTVARNNLCRWYWAKQDTITLEELFELVISCERDSRPGYLISGMLDVRCIGITTFLKVVKSMEKINFGDKCNLIWKEKYNQFVVSKRVRGRFYSWSKPITQDGII